jgi:hypothetical protein
VAVVAMLTIGWSIEGVINRCDDNKKP